MREVSDRHSDKYIDNQTNISTTRQMNNRKKANVLVTQMLIIVLFSLRAHKKGAPLLSDGKTVL